MSDLAELMRAHATRAVHGRPFDGSEHPDDRECIERTAADVIAALGLEDSGLAYCTAHNGVIDCDEQSCDFLDPSNPEHGCQECGGDGFDPDDEDEECPSCTGEGVTPCDPAILLYRRGSWAVES